jgi:hypothetical protein
MARRNSDGSITPLTMPNHSRMKARLFAPSARKQASVAKTSSTRSMNRERLNRTQEVDGSSPFSSTNSKSKAEGRSAFCLSCFLLPAQCTSAFELAITSPSFTASAWTSFAVPTANEFP